MSYQLSLHQPIVVINAQHNCSKDASGSNYNAQVLTAILTYSWRKCYEKIKFLSGAGTRQRCNRNQIILFMNLLHVK